MEKTLKRLLLLIPILIIAFPLKNVYADEPIDIYWASAYGDYQFSPFSSNVNEYTPNSLPFKAYDNYFILHNGNTYGNSRNFCFILYDKANDLYILQCNEWDRGNACSKYEDKYYIDIRGKQPYCKNSSGSWVPSSNQNNWYAILSTKGESTYFSNITSLSPNISNNGTYYLTQNKRNRSWGEILTFLKNNYSNFELAGIDNDFILYINSVEVPKITEPEPEPETPSVPPYIFDNTKYYVPNYDERNCVEIIDKDTIRVFENEESFNYIDYYINSNYISKTGQVEVSYVKNCSNLEFTNIRYYGNDFPQILFITLVVITFSVGFPYILYKRFRKR